MLAHCSSPHCLRGLVEASRQRVGSAALFGAALYSSRSFQLKFAHSEAVLTW